MDSVFLYLFFKFILAHIRATGSLNVKYAGEPVYLVLPVILRLCTILSLGIISIVQLPFVVTMYPICSNRVSYKL